MTNNFNRIAGIYDTMALMVFGQKWWQIQFAPALHLKEITSILIVGGGSGQILKHMQSHHRIDYIDNSGRMLMRAHKQQTKSTVTFLYGDFLKWKPNQKYEAVLYPFFLDGFDESNLKTIMEKTRALLKADGKVHLIDFQATNAFQKLLIRLMYCFFRLTANLGTNKLPDLGGHLENAGFDCRYEETWKNGLVFYRIYSIRNNS